MDFQLLVPDCLDRLQGFPEQIMSAMALAPENALNIFAMFLCATFGYLLYTVAGGMRKKVGVDPYPVMLHCWMITIDSIGSVTFWLLLSQHCTVDELLGGAWVFLFFSIGLPIWVVMEARSILHCINSERERETNFGNLVKGGAATKEQARFWCLGMIAICFFVNMYALSMLGGFENCAIFIVWQFTNYVFALWTWRFWTARATEHDALKYQTTKLHVVIIVQITIMWVPGLSWYLALTPFLHTIWYYLGGIAMTALAVYNFYKFTQLKKELAAPVEAQ